MQLRLSLAGQAFIKHEEGLVLHPYNDQTSHPTVGYGHLISRFDELSGRFRNGITLDQAEALFIEDAALAERWLAMFITAQLSENQRIAITDLLFNEGVNPVAVNDPAQGTLGRLLNALDYDGAGAEFPRWNKGRVRVKKPDGTFLLDANGKPVTRIEVLPVLVARRARELALWKTPDAT